MRQDPTTGYADRLKTAADARKAMIAKLQPRVSVPAAQPIDRAARKAAELAQVRQARAAAKTVKQEAAAQVLEDARQAEEAVVAAALENRRGERKERKALSKVEAKAKRDARYAARKARQ